MTEENQPLDGNVNTTSVEDRESEEALDLETLFQDDNLSEDDVPVSREEFNRLQKGIKKIASQLGQTKSQPAVNNEVVETDDVSELFFAQIPKAERVQDDLQTIAKAKYGGSILKAWRGESWIQDKATALENAAKEDEVNRSKIDKPSPGTVSSKIDISKVKEEDVSKLPADKKNEWLAEQVRRERLAE